MRPVEQYNQELYHYGVKGMKWGVRKSEYNSMTKAERKKTRQDYKSDEKWKRKTLTKKNYLNVYNKALDKFNSELPEINKTLKRPKNGTSYTDTELKKLESRYLKRFNEIMTETINSVVKSPKSATGRYEFDMLIDDFNDMPYAALIDNTTDTVSLGRFR